jgi:nucleotide-binding universal stress UspA family protein
MTIEEIVMGQLKKIIVGHDLRDGGKIALRSAMVLASRCDTALRLVHVVEPQHPYQKMTHSSGSCHGIEEMAQQAGKKLQELVSSEELAQWRVEYEVHTGKPFVEIIVARRAWQADLIIIGGPSRKQFHLLGSTGERVIRKAMVPVLVARKALNGNAKRFLVPTDFSSGARKAAEEAMALAASFGGHIFFFHALDLIPYFAAYDDRIGMSSTIPPLKPEDLDSDWESFLSTLRLENVPWEKHTEEGGAARMILRYAKSIQADVIVMGTHGRSGLAHMLLGSVAEDVARKASCPVLTVRPEAFQFELP